MEAYRTLWGVEEDWGSFLERLSGVSGVEACLLYASEEDKKSLLNRRHVKLVLMLQTQGSTPFEHIQSLEKQIVEGLLYNPIKFNVHGGLDSWSDLEIREYFTLFLEIQKKYSGILILHETHRGRIMYSPWNTLKWLEEFPTLLLTSDLSHFVVVAERHLHSFTKLLKLINERTRHIHARPCSTEHIQLVDVNDPLFATDLEAFKGYWYDIIKTQLRLGHADISYDPEFGPFPYEIASGGDREQNIIKIGEIMQELYKKAVEENKTLFLDWDDDKYSGVIIKSGCIPSEVQEFMYRLDLSLAHWSAIGKRGVWLKISKECSMHIPHLIQKSFEFHSVDVDQNLVLNCWLDKTKVNSLPKGPSHYVGVGGVVIHDNKILTVQEANGPLRGTKFNKIPTGTLNENESVKAGIERELLEETAIKCEFLGVIGFRHAVNCSWTFGKSDLFFICLLKPLSTDIVKQDSEISHAGWLDLDEYYSQKFPRASQSYDKMQEIIKEAVQQYLKDGSVNNIVNVVTLPSGWRSGFEEIFYVPK